MTTLNLYKERNYNVIKLADKAGLEIEYKIPSEYTVEEVERLIELEIKRDKLEKTEVDEETEQLQSFWAIVFEQLEILFQHYHPEMDNSALRNLLTHQQALEIIGFYNTNRFQENKEAGTSKKKAHSLS